MECVNNFIHKRWVLPEIREYQRLVHQLTERNKYLTKKYVKAQPRIDYPGKNVVYIITTPGLKRENRYIMGKAKVLKTRLSTYNKTDEHEVIFYQSCLSEEIMVLVEKGVFLKLSKYREQANRERFILPENSDIDLFTREIKSCIKFFNE